MAKKPKTIEKFEDASDQDFRDKIARAEDDIERLHKTLDGCRKGILLSKIAIAIGGALTVTYFLSAISFDPAIMIGAIGAAMGGTVVLGSNFRTSNDVSSALEIAERDRNKLIDIIRPRIVH